MASVCTSIQIYISLGFQQLPINITNICARLLLPDGYANAGLANAMFLCKPAVSRVVSLGTSTKMMAPIHERLLLVTLERLLL